MKRRRTDIWDDSPETTARSSSRSKPITSDEPKRSAEKSGFSDPPVQIKIVHMSGKETVLRGEEITADNAIVRKLTTIRNIQRFWRLNVTTTSGTLKYRTDAGMIAFAAMAGYRISDPVEAGKAMNHIAEWFEVTESDKPREVDGEWVRVPAPGESATPAT